MAIKVHKLVNELKSRGGAYSQATSIDVRREGETLSSRSLQVSFQRTIRVSDNNTTNDLPPSLGPFPLFQTSDYKSTLPQAMQAKGGYFLPMHRDCYSHPETRCYFTQRQRVC